MTVVEEFIFGIPLVKLPTYRTEEPVGRKPIAQRETIDFALLDEMIEFIEENPRTWDQGSWFKIMNTETGQERYISRIETVEEVNSCGSSFCLAGHVALRAGFPAPPLDNTKEWTRNVDGDDWPEDVETFARKRLGLTESQAGAFFAGENDLLDLKRMALLLKVDPNIPGWKLEDVRMLDENEFLEQLKEHLGF